MGLQPSRDYASTQDYKILFKSQACLLCGLRQPARCRGSGPAERGRQDEAPLARQLSFSRATRPSPPRPLRPPLSATLPRACILAASLRVDVGSAKRSCLLRELHRFESIAIAQDPISARGSCQQYGETWAHQEPNGACSSAHSQAYHQKDAVPSTNCPSAKYDRTHYLWPPLMAEATGKPILCCGCYAEGRSSASRYPKPLVPLEKPAKEVVSPETTSTFEKLEVAPPSPGQLKHVFFHNALPFVGFGFLDNAIMIAAGTQIELSIGVVLGISTMAAAALGNLVSDLAGLGLAGYVEALASRLGLSIPDLTPKQADMWQTRLSAHLGKAIGVTIGCILGMFPLLFFGDEEEKLEEKN
ncbi:PREDICTED: transmembrane protein 65 [Aptenodytes forsteri]|uniref:transmembrane protein 65 n=1 Tax=Aptenodytes forsteri TaxID=9233 RepID=UPI00090553B9|nr:PREDICTED: transmembrane protein 65 [Aptenodytes forsteri]